MGRRVHAAIEEKREKLFRDSMEIYYTGVTVPRPPHAHLIPHVEAMRAAYMKDFGRPSRRGMGRRRKVSHRIRDAPKAAHTVEGQVVAAGRMPALLLGPFVVAHRRPERATRDSSHHLSGVVGSV